MLKEKLIRTIINIQNRLSDKTAAVNTTELVILLFAAVTISICVVVSIKKLMGNGETDDGVLKNFKDYFDSKQN